MTDVCGNSCGSCDNQAREKTIYKNFLAAKQEMRNVVKDTTNTFFRSKYATLDQVIDQVKPALNKYGLDFYQNPGVIRFTEVKKHEFVRNRDRVITGEFSWTETIAVQELATVIYDEHGDKLEFWSQIPLGEMTPQGMGSANTYSRRYTLLPIMGIAAGEDDDGNAASGRNASEPNKQASSGSASGVRSKISSSQLKRDGAWDKFLEQVKGKVNIDDLMLWIESKEQQDIMSKWPVAWLEQANEAVAARMDSFRKPDTEDGAYLSEIAAHMAAANSKLELDQITSGNEVQRIKAAMRGDHTAEVRDIYKKTLAAIKARDDKTKAPNTPPTG